MKMRIFRVEIGLFVFSIAFVISFFGSLTITLDGWRIVDILAYNPNRYWSYIQDALTYVILPLTVGLGFSIVAFIREIQSPTKILDVYWFPLTAFGIFFFFWGLLGVSGTYHHVTSIDSDIGPWGEVAPLVRSVHMTMLVGYLLWTFGGLLFMLSPMFRTAVKRREHSRKRELKSLFRVDYGFLLLLFLLFMSGLFFLSASKPLTDLMQPSMLAEILKKSPNRFAIYVRETLLWLVLPPAIGLAYNVTAFRKKARTPTENIDAILPYMIVFGILLLLLGIWGVRGVYLNYLDAARKTSLASYVDARFPIVVIYAVASVASVLWICVGLLLLTAPRLKEPAKEAKCKAVFHLEVESINKGLLKIKEQNESPSMILVVASNKDIASQNISKQILNHYPFQKTSQNFQETPTYEADINHKEVKLVALKEESIYAQYLPEPFQNVELVVFVSRHSSESSTPTLSVHTPGNLSNAELGGLPRTVSVSPANAMRDALKTLAKLKEEMKLQYDVSYECTHHGPSLNTPTMFVELGSSLEQWKDLKAAEAVAHATMQSISEFGKSKATVAIGIGGTHYNAKFTKMALEKEKAFSHMIPKYAIQHIDTEILKQCASRTLEKVKSAVLDWKGIKSEHKPKIINMLKEISLPIQKT